VNGKLRGSVRIARDATEEQVLSAALAVPGIAKFVTGEVRKVVYVKGRVMSLVVAGR
jgi:leucyl-tRNA synthetase